MLFSVAPQTGCASRRMDAARNIRVDKGRIVRDRQCRGLHSVRGSKRIRSLAMREMGAEVAKPKKTLPVFHKLAGMGLHDHQGAWPQGHRRYLPPDPPDSRSFSIS